MDNEMFNNKFNKQLTKQIFDILPEQGPLMLIINNDGERWVNDSRRLNECKIDELFLKELCMKIDDGAEPVLAQLNDYSIVGSQFRTEISKGYVILIQPQSGPESALSNIDLIEIIIGQVNLIAGLIEENNKLYEFQFKRLNRNFASVLN